MFRQVKNPLRAGLQWLSLGMVLLVVAPFCVWISAMMTVNHTGYFLGRALTGSMEPTIMTNDFMIHEAVTFADIAVGDIVTYDGGVVDHICHRVIEIGADYAILQGDANAVADAPVMPEQIVSRVVAVHDTFTPLVTLLVGRWNVDDTGASTLRVVVGMVLGMVCLLGALWWLYKPLSVVITWLFWRKWGKAMVAEQDLMAPFAVAYASAGWMKRMALLWRFTRYYRIAMYTPREANAFDKALAQRLVTIRVVVALATVGLVVTMCCHWDGIVSWLVGAEQWGVELEWSVVWRAMGWLLAVLALIRLVWLGWELWAIGSTSQEKSLRYLLNLRWELCLEHSIAATRRKLEKRRNHLERLLR